MQAKETVQTRWNRLRRQRGTGEKVSVDATALLRFADTAIHFLLAAVLAGASVFGDYAPFGVALVGAGQECAARRRWWEPASAIWCCWALRMGCGMPPRPY